MPLQYTVSNGNQVGKVSTTDIAQQLQQQGEQVHGISPDGTTIHMGDAHGQFDVPTDQVLQKLGWQVNDVKPLQADYGNLDSGMRVAVHSLPNDATRRAYLEDALTQRGIQQPKIVGAGRNWYAYNPHTSQYVALTNDPDHFGMADAAEGMMDVPRAFGAGLGASAGFALGGGTPASIAGAAAGAAAGGGAIDTLERSALAAIDPSYRHVAGDNMGAMAGDVAIKAAMDGVVGGTFAGAPMAARAVASRLYPGAESAAEAVTRGLTQNGALSTMARAGGAAARVSGRLTSDAAGFLNNPVGREFVGFGDPLGVVWGGIPGVGEAELGGMMMQAPAAAPGAVAKGLGYAGDKLAGSDMAGRFLGEENRNALAQRLTTASKGVLRDRGFGNPTPTEAQEVGDMFRMGGPTAEEQIAKGYSRDPRNTWGNVFENSARGVAKSSSVTNFRRARIDAFRQALEYGVPHEDALNIGRAAGEDVIGPIGQKWGQRGELFGDFLGDVAAAGRGIQGAARSVVGGGLNALQYGGAQASRMGAGIENAATVLQPLENQQYLRQLLNERYRDRLNRRMQGMLGGGNPSALPIPQSSMEETLASAY